MAFNKLESVKLKDKTIQEFKIATALQLTAL